MTLNVLFVGGTGQISLPCVELAIAAGHKVSVFNRGQRAEPLPKGAISITGDMKDPQSYAQLGQQHWDVVNQFMVFTPEQMQQGLSDGYAAAAQASGARVAPVGQAWAQALVEAPTIDLFDPDGSHPSLAGSFLADCVFFAVLTGQPAAASDYVPAGLAASDADLLEPLADQAAGL